MNKHILEGFNEELEKQAIVSTIARKVLWNPLKWAAKKAFTKNVTNKATGVTTRKLAKGRLATAGFAGMDATTVGSDTSKFVKRQPIGGVMQ